VKVRAVLFDAGHTLLEADYGCLAAQIRARGHAVTDADVVAAERRARARLDEEQAAQPTRERRGVGRYLRYLFDQLGIADQDDIAAVAAWRRGFNLPVGLCHRADPEALDALSRLRAAGIVTGVISNSNGSVRQALDAAGLLPQLSFVIDSTVVGIAKPDPRVFHLGLTAAHVDASEAVYVGDSYFVDVRGARAVGMDGVLFDPGEVWGPRDCPIAKSLSQAAARAVSLPPSTEQPGRQEQGGGDGQIDQHRHPS
jgi:FMN phosphatase YigB (HAD superfamily)